MGADSLVVGPLRDLVETLAWLGRLIPKARWYSSELQNVGKSELADELTRVNGLSGTLFICSIFVYLLFAIYSKRKIEQRFDDAVLLPQAQKNLQTVYRLSLALMIISAYYSFVGFGLTRGGGFKLPSESISGNFVIGATVVGFPSTFMWMIYGHQTYWYLKRRRFIKESDR